MMKIDINFICSSCVYIFLLFNTHDAMSAQRTPKELCAYAEQMIINNHYDAQGSTQQGMELGIKKMKEAIALGCPDQRHAMLILVDSYDQMLNPPSAGSAADKSRINERNQLLRKMYTLYPEDIEILQRYAERMASEDEKIDIYRKLIQIDPNKTESHYLLFISLMRFGRLNEGVKEAIISLELESRPDVIRVYASGIVDQLVQSGCDISRIDQWETIFNDLEMKLSSDDVSVRNKSQFALSEKKSELIQMLEKLKCMN